MNKINIVRAWKDEAYRQSLSPEQLENLPEHPSGLVELPEELLGYISGGMVAKEFAHTVSFDTWDINCTAGQSCDVSCTNACGTDPVTSTVTL